MWFLNLTLFSLGVGFYIAVHKKFPVLKKLLGDAEMTTRMRGVSLQMAGLPVSDDLEVVDPADSCCDPIPLAFGEKGKMGIDDATLPDSTAD